MLSKIKIQYTTKRIAFNNSAIRLGLRNDLDDLAIIAQESQDQSLIKLFEVLPELSILKRNKIDDKLKAIVAELKT